MDAVGAVQAVPTWSSTPEKAALQMYGTRDQQYYTNGRPRP